MRSGAPFARWDQDENWARRIKLWPDSPGENCNGRVLSASEGTAGGGGRGEVWLRELGLKPSLTRSD